MVERRRTGLLVGCAALASAAIAFPAGLIVANVFDRPAEVGSGSSSDRTSRAASRDVYSPKVLTDPFVIEQQTLVVEAMERRCRERNETCREARNGRTYLDKHRID